MNQLSRTNFLTLLTSASVSNQPGGQPTNTGLAPYTGPWDQPQIAHLIRRTLFGLTPNDLKYFSKLSLEQSLEVLLTQSPFSPPPVNVYNHEKFTDPDVPWGQTWVYAPYGDPEGEQDGLRVQNLKAWWVGQMLNQDHSITEKMTLFWSNFLATQMFSMKDARLDYGYRAAISNYALGNYKQLVRLITTNPGMLEYLNGNLNTATAPNENYARELQELFTVGKGPDSHYTERDVKEAARILTGWSTEDREGGVFNSFKPEDHDQGDKTFSAFYNNTVIKGRNGADGRLETDELIEMLFKQPETARNFCRNLYRWFVNYNIDETVEQNVIAPLANLLIKNNFEIIPVLKTLLGSEHFFDAVITGCQIKNPADLLIGSCRQLNIQTFTDLKEQYQSWFNILSMLFQMGMDPGDPPHVSGWPAYYQQPAYDKIWINAATLSIRNIATDLLCTFGFGSQPVARCNLLLFAAQLPKPADLDTLIQDSIFILSPLPLDAQEIGLIRSVFLNEIENTPNMKKVLRTDLQKAMYWTDAWNEYMFNPEDEIAKSVVLNRLTSAYKYLLQRAEYQLM